MAKKLTEAVTQGYGKQLPEVDYDTPDHNMLTNLQKNIWRFSSAKNNVMLADMNAQLTDPAGKLRSFKDFERQVQKINTQYNLHWLKTEYTAAVNGSNMASRWADIEGSKEASPLLQ